MYTIYDILARLKSVEGPDGSGNYKACCPAHDDKKQSLSVKQGDKGIVFKCFAGCGTREICEHLGIEMKDLFADKPKDSKPKQKRKIVKVYPYTDKDGKLLFEVVRYEPKSFAQRMPDPTMPGQYIWKHCPIQPLYRLPEVNKAIEAGEWVCIAEGEKDADTLVRLGYCGTTIAMGAGKWKTQHTEQLQGARVALFADNDAAGREHVSQIGAAVKDVVKAIKFIFLDRVWPEMPDKGDVSDLAEKLGDEKAKELIELAFLKASSGQAANAQAKTPLEQAQMADDTEAGRLYTQVPGYTVKDGCICQFTADGGCKQLSTFAAIPRKAIARDDGQTVSTGFEVEGWDRHGKGLGTAWVSSREFGAMTWPVENWGFAANIMPGNTNKDKLRFVIAEVGSLSAVKSTLYTHTGWRRIGGELMYLHGGGAIGGENVSVALEGKLGAYTMTPADVEVSEAAKASLGFMDVMRQEVATVLLGVTYLAPLHSFMQSKGIAPRFVVYLSGKTQSRKTTAALLALSHFGNFNGQDKIPASFADTSNSVQRSAFLLKDMPLLVDDYHPTSSPQARRKMEEAAQSLARSFGNGGSRGRLNADMTQRAGLPPRSVAIFTGEDVPDIKESGLARYFIVSMGAQSVPPTDELTRLQEMAAEGYLQRAMQGYIEWLKARADELPEKLYKAFTEWRSMVSKMLGAGGSRAAEAVTQLTIGIRMMYHYMSEIGVVSKEEANRKTGAALDILVDVARRQAGELESQKPVNLFRQILAELLASGRFQCLEMGDPKGSINVLGYVDDTYYYLYPEITYQAVSKFCSDQGTSFPVGFMQLKKQMVEMGIITEDMTSKAKKLKGKTIRCLWLPRGYVDKNGEETPPQKEPAQLAMDLQETDEEAPF